MTFVTMQTALQMNCASFQLPSMFAWIQDTIISVIMGFVSFSPVTSHTSIRYCCSVFSMMQVCNPSRNL